MRRGADGLDQRNEFKRLERGLQQALGDLGAAFRRQCGENGIGRAVDQRIAVFHRDGETHADADILGGARHLGGFGRQIGQALRARIVHHHRAGVAERAVRAGHHTVEVRIDRGQEAGIADPGLQRLAAAADRAGPRRAAVVVAVHQRRQRDDVAAGRPAGDGGDGVAVDGDILRGQGRFVGARDDVGTRNLAHE